MLVPAGVLVLFVLASISVDAAVAFLAQRELSAAAAAAANDAAGAAVSDQAFYADGTGTPAGVVLDQGKAEQVARRALDARVPRGVAEVVQEVVVDGDQVCVTVTGRVAYVFARAVPGAARGRTVTGRAVATAVLGGSAAADGSGAAPRCGP